MTNAGVEPYGELVARALRYAGPVRMNNGSASDLVFELATAIETLRNALTQAQETLNLIINPAEFKNTSVMSAWALAVEAESRARTALRGEP